MDELLILTDHRNFSCACAPQNLMREISRHPLHAPITINHWRRSHALSWTLVRTYTFPEA